MKEILKTVLCAHKIYKKIAVSHLFTARFITPSPYFKMFFVFSTLAVLQALSLARFVASDSGSAPFLKMAKAIQNPTKHLAMHKRSSAKVNPNFVSSESTYWLVVSIHSGTSCDSKIVKKQGVACGFCFQDDETSSSSQFQ